MPELPEVETTRRGLAPHVEGRRVDGRHAAPARPALADSGRDRRACCPASASTRCAGAPSTCCSTPPPAARCCTWACPAACACCRRRRRSARTTMSTWPLDSGPGAALQRPAPLRLPAVAAGRARPTNCWRARAGAAVGRVRRRLPVRTQPRPQRAGEDLPDGPAHRGRGRQHLCRRGPVRRRHLAAARGRARSRASATRGWPTRSGASSAMRSTRGGTTLRDFISPDGAPGYFEQELSAYGRGGEPCPRCGRPLKQAWHRRSARRSGAGTASGRPIGRLSERGGLPARSLPAAHTCGL